MRACLRARVCACVCGRAVLGVLRGRGHCEGAVSGQRRAFTLQRARGSNGPPIGASALSPLSRNADPARGHNAHSPHSPYARAYSTTRSCEGWGGRGRGRGRVRGRGRACEHAAVVVACHAVVVLHRGVPAAPTPRRIPPPHRPLRHKPAGLGPNFAGITVRICGNNGPNFAERSESAGWGGRDTAPAGRARACDVSTVGTRGSGGKGVSRVLGVVGVLLY